ncbi:hypothetical protein V6N11_016787 [Hibiscus sabdariffa]|uniref:Uncharacterized protein n=1 Tax=Hibiscus sabdariffa TaxID=183260 RepID=A0ABR2TW80_9ROSI
MDSWDRTGFYLMMLLLRSFGRARSSLVFYVWLALLDLEEIIGLKGCFPTRPEDSVEMSTAKGTSSGSIEEGGEKKKLISVWNSWLGWGYAPSDV